MCKLNKPGCVLGHGVYYSDRKHTGIQLVIRAGGTDIHPRDLEGPGFMVLAIGVGQSWARGPLMRVIGKSRSVTKCHG